MASLKKRWHYRNMMKDKVIISLGGSIIVPDGINFEYFKKFKQILAKHKDKQFYVIIGGGKTCRRYIETASKVKKLDQEQKDWIGIYTTHLNANTIRILFGKDAYKEIVTNPHQTISTNKQIIVGAGYKPGCTTDYDSVLIAKNSKAKTVINITNVDYLYDKNPKKHKDAKRIEKTNWKAMKKIVGIKHKPGINSPFGPKAVQLASKLNLKLILIGPDPKALENCLNGKKFKGSVVTN